MRLVIYVTTLEHFVLSVTGKALTHVCFIFTRFSLF